MESNTNNSTRKRMVDFEDFDNLTKETNPLLTIRSITKTGIRLDDISHCSHFFLIGLYNKSNFITIRP